MGQKSQLPEITKEEFLEAISEGVARAFYAMASDREISFFAAIEDGVRQATEKSKNNVETS